MTTRDVGDGLLVAYEARDPDTGDLTSATVALKVIDPDDTQTTPSPTSDTSGVYEHTIDLSKAGLWRWIWTVSGTIEDVAYGDVFAQEKAPRDYATVPDLRNYLGLGTDGASDDQLAGALSTVSREIDLICGRRFWPDTTATAALFYPRDDAYVRIDDVWTTTDLVVKTDADGDGTFETTWSATDYQLEPLGGRSDGQTWPYNTIRAVGTRRFPTNIGGRAPVQVTAKWGWASVPDPVRQACLIMAAETFKLSEAPFGVAGFDQFGPVRLRVNPLAQAKLGPYRILVP